MKNILKNKYTRILITKYRKIRCILPKKVKYCAKCILRRFSEINNKKPNTIQLPITYKCNFDCVMCGMKTMIGKKDISLNELETILKDELFNNVLTIGVNGGEPFILKNIYEYIEVLIRNLPKLKNIYMISNGYFTENILNSSKKIKELCSSNGVKYHLSISLDGIGEMQNIMRGHSHAFEKSIETCKKILNNRELYCDDFNTICTITKINVYNLPEIEAFTKMNNIPITYNIATIHKRLNNDYKYDDFSIFSDELSTKMAAEFLYSKFLETKKEFYFARYYYVKYKKRIALCGHKSNVVTLTPNGAISYCATFSKEIGNALKKSANELFFDKKNLKYKKVLHSEYCDSCSHYSESLSKEGYKIYFKELKKIFKV